jgi:multidrug efflux pump subunit AcrA (membrane-fusion protein)
MRIGSKPELVLPELPNQRFLGTLVRTADAMDPATRTLLIEVDVLNRSGLLMPNAYAEVHFSINAQGERLLIPTESLLFRSEGLRVPVVVEGNKVALVPVKLGRDFGKAVEVLGGLDENTRVIADPPDSLVDGEVVRIAQPKPNSSERPPNAP